MRGGRRIANGCAVVLPPELSDVGSGLAGEARGVIICGFAIRRPGYNGSIMKLPVLEKTLDDAPWYADGLKFTCSQCGNCCTGGPGYVWISNGEIALLAEHLKIAPETVVEQYCRKIDGKFSLKERRSPAGLYDCVFLKETKVSGRAGSGSEGDDGVIHTIRACTVYPVRPLQCRTWPFWPENLASEQAWNHSARKCHGMNAPGRTFSLDQIHSVRDAAEWPKNPPTSARRATKKDPP